MRKLIKTSLFALTALFFTISVAAAQDAPQKVKDAFSAKYANATNVEWEKNDDKNEQGYEVDFDMDGQEYDAKYMDDGTWKYTKNDIKKDALPAAITQSIKDNYANFKIDDAEQLDTPDGRRYVVDIEMDKEEKELLYKEDGTIVEELTEQEDEDDDDDGWFSSII